ncbi:MAG: hypothetical protein K0Q79_2842 [Flavipsychrobacter sp.]|jgi:hypothetical protein|nr:hypothetical protein [Flavipsychrobacter sp.]
MSPLTDLIKKITPLYNQYKETNTTLSGLCSLLLMWEIGDLIKEFVEKNDIAPHNLYRQIYGKSEGKDNIVQKSYITREFQGRCFRIRNIFPTKDTAINLLPNLKDFTSFREAMPFFDNSVYKLNNSKFNELLLLLNSSKKSSDIIKELEVWKKSINNISNSRSQKLDNLENEKKTFIDFYNFVYKLNKDYQYSEAVAALGVSDNEILILISKNLTALAQEGISIYEMPEVNIQTETSSRFYSTITKLLKPKDEKERRRFRRLIPPERIIRLSVLVNSFTSEYLFNKIK